MQEPYDGLRSFRKECEKHGEVTTIRDADWNLEIGAITEMAISMSVAGSTRVVVAQLPYPPRRPRRKSSAPCTTHLLRRLDIRYRKIIPGCVT